MEQMLDFLEERTTKKEANKQAIFARKLPEYNNSKPEVKYVYDKFIEITQ